MAWEGTKTNWKATDYYNLADAKRIYNNICYLIDTYESAGYTSGYSSSDVITRPSQATIASIEMFNNDETILEAIRTVFNSAVSEDYNYKTWNVGDAFDYIQLNRLESNCQVLYDWLYQDQRLYLWIPRCSTYLGGEIW